MTGATREETRKQDEARKLDLLLRRVGSVILGKDRAIRLAVATLLARGHLLIEDVPGVGKTTLAFTLATAVHCSFQRIQFTSDMLPADIIGVSIFNPDAREFEFRAGPLFANIVLADEINRTTPKTQSALLEAMNERRVSVDRVTHPLPEPFMVIATENPVEYRGTFPLPESQLDRFMMHLSLGYPAPEDERRVLAEGMDFRELHALGPVLDGADIVAMQERVGEVRVDGSVIGYVLDIVGRTRVHGDILLGASTRGAQFLVRMAKSLAYMEGRGYVLPSDVKEVAPQVLGHRLILKRQTYLAEAVGLVEGILDETPVPA
jgi:MoxR-like ATPase